MMERVMTESMHCQRGVGLVEVLVAVLILGIGLLGLAALQTQSLKYNGEAYLRTQATILAMDMADRLRANRKIALDQPALYTLDETDEPSVSVDLCSSQACTASELAQYDFAQWRTRLREVLPGGTGTLQPNTSATASTAGREYLITVKYDLSFGRTEEDGADALEKAQIEDAKVSLQYRTKI
jgi:type IV pilus assembly protein PilV